MSQTLNAIITQEGKFYVAQNPDTGITSQGSTIDESITNLKEALLLCFEELGKKNSRYTYKHSFLITVEV